MKNKKMTGLIAAIAAVGLIAGCSGDDPEMRPTEETAVEATTEEVTEEVEETTEPEAEDETTEEAAEPEETATEEETTEPEPEPEVEDEDDFGTRANPGQPNEDVAIFTDGENTYEVSVGYTDFEANDAIAAENQFNDPPGEGMTYALVPVTVTYYGPETMTPWLDLSANYVAGNGRSYSQAYAVTPDDLSDVGDLYDGATATGNLLFEVPLDAIDGSVYAVSVGWGTDDLFFAAVTE